MFDFLFSKTRSRIKFRHFSDTSKYAPLIWSEHCMECAAPLCYASCPRFVSRRDGHCVRVQDGITYHDEYVVCNFKSWGKIESPYFTHFINGESYRKLSSRITKFDNFCKFFLSLPFPLSIRRLISDFDYSYRLKYIKRYVKHGVYPKKPILHIECSSDKDAVLSVDIKDIALRHRETIEVGPSYKEFDIALPLCEDGGNILINIHPLDAELEVKVQFKEIELIDQPMIESQKKIKLIIWDLDNTLWRGILIETANVELRKDFVSFIKETDKKGVIHSISSKNNQEEAERKLADLGILDYFVFRKINWLPKSQNISNTIRQMNINADTVVFIDDNPFERAEVSSVVDGISCIDPEDLVSFKNSERLNIIVSDESAKRRETYRQMEAMQQEKDAWSGNIDDFLKSCQLTAILSHPDDSNVDRCYELLQRSNQLNSSGRRIPLDELQRIIDLQRRDCYVIKAKDKFGEYGIVGYTMIDAKEEIAVMTDFVISCRVANRKLEPTVMNYLAHKYNDKLLIDFKPTNRNMPMKLVIEDLNASLTKTIEDHEFYEHVFNEYFAKIVEIDDKDLL